MMKKLNVKSKTFQKYSSISNENWKIKMHLNYNDLINNKEKHIENVKNRNMENLVNVQKIYDIHTNFSNLKKNINSIREQRNLVSKKVSQDLNEKTTQTTLGKELKEKCALMEKELSVLEEELEAEAKKLPNTTSSYSPYFNKKNF
jgi:seryl-tRNA synthetase